MSVTETFIISLISSLIAGILGGLVVLGVQHFLTSRKESRKELDSKIIKAKQSDKIINNDVVYSLAPGNSIDLMREMLGSQTKYSKEDSPVFSDEIVKTNSYLYLFKNAHVKITSKDNKTIDSLTVFAYDNHITIPEISYFCEDAKTEELGKATVCSELVKASINHTLIQNIRERSFAINVGIGAPIYRGYTFFGFADKDGYKYRDNPNPKLFIGCTIEGFCITDSYDADVYYIYEYELR
jgi:hypothetical protein